MATSADLTDICRQIIDRVLDDRLLSTIESHYDVDRTERLRERIGPAYSDQIRADVLDASSALADLYADQSSDDVALSRIGQFLKSKAADCRTYHNEYVRPSHPERCFAHLQQLDDISRALQQLGSREFVALQEFIWYYWGLLLDWLGHLAYCEHCCASPPVSPIFPPLDGTEILEEAGATSSLSSNALASRRSTSEGPDLSDIPTGAPDHVFRVELGREQSGPLAAKYRHIPLRKMPGYAAITFHSQTPPIPHLLSVLGRDHTENAIYTHIDFPDTDVPLGADLHRHIDPVVLSGRDLRTRLADLRSCAQALATHIEDHVLPRFNGAASLLVEIEADDDLTHVLFRV